MCFELELLGNNIESPLDLSVFRYSPMHELTVGTARITYKLEESLKDETRHPIDFRLSRELIFGCEDSKNVIKNIDIQKIKWQIPDSK